MQSACSVCGQLSSGQRCGRCKTTAYCSKECQRSGWREHKKHCVQSESMRDNPTSTYTNTSRSQPSGAMLWGEEDIEKRLSETKSTCDWWHVQHDGTAKALPGCTERKAGKIVKGKKMKLQHTVELPKSSKCLKVEVFSCKGENAGPYAMPNMDMLMFSGGLCRYQCDVVLHFIE